MRDDLRDDILDAAVDTPWMPMATAPKDGTRFLAAVVQGRGRWALVVNWWVPGTEERLVTAPFDWDAFCAELPF